MAETIDKRICVDKRMGTTPSRTADTIGGINRLDVETPAVVPPEIESDGLASAANTTDAAPRGMGREDAPCRRSLRKLSMDACGYVHPAR